MSNPTLVWSEKLTRKQSDRLIRWGKSIQLAERERIIGLLETQHNCKDDDYICICAVGDLIELIKGDNK